jgi:CRP-like cAMP-binding protein
MNPRHNELLANLPPEEFRRFLGRLELVSLTRGQILFQKGDVPTHVYFPVGALVSVICELDDGVSMESNMVGKSSLLGLSNYGVPSFYTAKVRASGFAYRLDLTYYRLILNKCPVYQEGLNRAQLMSFRYISINGACAKNHRMEQQLARWMLVNLDRTFEKKVYITHAELSSLLGFRREVITTTLGKMEETGAIKRGRGVLEVIQREALEKLSCDCYWQICGKFRPAFTELIQADQ